MFQSLTRDSNHSNRALEWAADLVRQFQSLTRDSNHSNLKLVLLVATSGAVSIPHAG